MSKRKLMKGSEAMAEAAIRNGCRYFFGYPITPQTEIPEYFSERMFEEDVQGCFLQAESELAAINMVYGAASTGARVLTSSSSPGISLKQEGISTLCAAELPCAIYNVMRSGPGIAGIQASQGDYFQATKGGGHGDYNLIVFAPSSVQESVDCIGRAFDLADEYRMPVMICADGIIAQMMEPTEMPGMREYHVDPEKKPWAATGYDPLNPQGQRANVTSTYTGVEEMDALQARLQKKYAVIREKEAKFELYNMEKPVIVLTAFGTISRLCKSAIDQLKKSGVEVGLVRPITIWPFPYDAVAESAELPPVKAILDVEMNAGQMLEDVKLAVNGKKPVAFYGRSGAHMPTTAEIKDKILKMLEE